LNSFLITGFGLQVASYELRLPRSLGELAMTENIPSHPNPLPPRGGGVRREKYFFLYLYRKEKRAKKKPIKGK